MAKCFIGPCHREAGKVIEWAQYDSSGDWVEREEPVCEACAEAINVGEPMHPETVLVYDHD